MKTSKKVELSKIQWTGVTWNPWHGCRKVSAGCKFCYMFRDKERYGQKPTDVLKSKTKFNEPTKWSEPQLIFTCSWSDWFIEEADQWRPEAWQIIKDTPHHIYQILTKRPERILDNLPSDWGDGYPNVWLGVSVESNNEKDRIETLSKVPAKIRFISAEPLIGELTLDELSANLKENFQWMIIGGESGNKTGNYLYREAKIEWFKSLIKISKKTNVKVFVKQLGTFLADELKLKDKHGGDANEFEKALQIREFPINMDNFIISKE